jgi:hypothetical protein
MKSANCKKAGMRQWHRQRPSCGGLCVLTSVVLLGVTPAQAGSINLGDRSATLDYLVNLTYSAAWRAEKPDDRLTANINGDDGDRNFDQGSMINNRLAVLGELNFRYGYYGAFVRGSAFYDDVYHRDNDNDSPDTVNKSGPNDQFSDAAEKYLGERARLLDAYVYGGWNIGSTALDLRVGRQVVSWGESLFFPNMSGAQSPADATKSNVPGTEVKEILLPVGQAYVQWGLMPRVSLAAYYQWEWQGTELNPAGAYFSTTDVIGPGAEYLRLANLPLPPPLPTAYNVPRGADLKPDDDGQWGVSTKFQLGDATELGVYHIVYHDKAPVGVLTQTGTVNFDLGGGVVVPVPGLPASYQALYVDDIKMTAISVATQLMGTAIAGEVSYRQDAGININVGATNSPTPGRADAVQANLSFTRLILPTVAWDTLTLVGEVSWLQVEDVQPIEVDGESYDTPSNGEKAAAYQMLAQFGYQQVFPGWDLTLSFVAANMFDGKPAINGALGSLTGEGDERYSTGFSFKYQQNLELQLAYNGYRGTPNLVNKTLADRSNVAFSAKYSF